MNRDIIVFDFETGGRNPMRCQPTQIAAIALDGRNFKLKGGDLVFFVSNISTDSYNINNLCRY